MITQKEALKLANKWKINWTPTYRRATCVKCGKNMHKMWHFWLSDGGYKKEIHFCRKCWKV